MKNSFSLLAWRAARGFALGAALFITGTAQASLLANPGGLADGATVVGFDSLAPVAGDGSRATVFGLPGVALGVQAINGPLRSGPANQDWSLGSNGQWSAQRSYVGVDAGADSNANIYAALVFDFGSMRVQQVGAFINYNPDYSYGGGFALPLYLAAYDASGHLLDSHELHIRSPGATDGGAFYGIATVAASISRFEISAPFAVVDNLSFTTPVPDAPAAWLAGAGLVVLGLRRRVFHHQVTKRL